MKTKKILSILSVILVTVAAQAMAQSNIFTDPITFKLKNGAAVAVAENKYTAKVYSGITFDVDTALSAKTGCQELIVIILNESAVETQAGLSFNEKGGNINTSVAGYDYALNSLKNILIDLVISPQQFANAQTELVESINGRHKYYPKEFTEEMINEIKLSDLQEYIKANFVPTKCHLTIVGNISPAEAKKMVKKAFGNWATETEISRNRTSR
ncbi:MAG: insulinase family protein [Bacteroidota bacterium]